MKGIFIFCPAGLLRADEYVSIVPIWGLLKDFLGGFLSQNTSLRPAPG